MSGETPAWRRYLRFGRPDISADIDDEVQFHIDERVHELQAAGFTEEDARTKAMAEFGDLALTRTELHEIDRRIQKRRGAGERLRVGGDEMRLAFRRLSRQPSFTLPAILTLGLGLACTAIAFTLIRSVLLRPLPFVEAENLVSLASPMPKLNDVWGIARHQLPYYKDNARAIEDMGLYRGMEVTIPGEGTVRAERIMAASVSASIFPTLRIAPELGRLFRDGDNIPRVARVVVLGHDYWMRRFGGDRRVIGNQLNVDGTLREIVGVTPKGASLPDRRVDIWVPDYIDPAALPVNNHVRGAIVRLRPGFNASDLESQIAPLVVRMDELFPSAYPNHWIANSGFHTSVTPLRDSIVGPEVTRALWVLFAAVWLVLFVAVVNVSNLVLVRAEAQRREIAMRTALGASRRVLALHFITEGLVISVIAGLFASGLAFLVLRALPVLAADTLPRFTEVHFAWETCGATLGLAVIVGIGLGMIPLRHATPDPQALREGSRTLGGPRNRAAFRNLLVVGQVAVTVVLLAGAGLLVRSGMRLRAVDPGFDPNGVTTLDVSLSPATYQSYEAATNVYRRLAERIQGVPGVLSAGFTEALPLSGELGCTGVDAPASGMLPPRGRCVPTTQTSPGYFATMGITVRGSAPDWSDAARRGGGVVISPALARRLWPDEDPIGQSIRCCRSGEVWDHVVGVTGEVHGNALDVPAEEIAYFSIAPPVEVPTNNWPLDMRMVIKAPTLSPAGLRVVVRDALAEIDPDIPVSEARRMTAVVAESMARRTFTLLLMGGAALLALMLSAVGLYGVIAYVVGQRQREIGVRIAIGASFRQIGRLVLGHSMRLVSAGIVIGLLGATLATHMLESMLFQVEPTEPVVLFGVVLLVLALGLIASGIPTLRAAKIDPMTALRAD